MKSLGWQTRGVSVDEKELLERITADPNIFGGKPIIRGRRLAVEHVLGMLAAGDTIQTILEGYPWLEPMPEGLWVMSASKHFGWSLLHETASGCLRLGRNA
jgi:uncharacterized protein (DUF433 family)